MMVDLRDEVNYYIFKILFVILNTLVVLGFIDSLHQFDNAYKIFFILCSCVVLIINVAGFSVFEIKMLTDKTSDASLLNHLFTMMSIIDQIRSILMFILIVIETYFEESESLEENIYLAKLFWTLLSVVNLAAITASSWIKQKNPTKYLNLSQNKICTWSIMAGQIVVSATIFGLLSIKCYEKEGWTCTENAFGKIGGTTFGFCLIILLRITAENQGIKPVHFFQNLKRKVRTIFDRDIEVVQQTVGILVAEEKFSDQGLLIYFGGVLIGVIGGTINGILVTTLEIDSKVRHFLGMVNLSLIPVYWIYKSEKLQLVIRKYL